MRRRIRSNLSRVAADARVKPATRPYCDEPTLPRARAGARNTGTLEANGDMIAFCDDDDEWLTDKLALQVKALLASQDHVAATCGLFIHFDGRTIPRLPPSPTVTLADLRRSRVREAHPSTILVPRAAVLGPIGLVDEAIPGSNAEDYEWLLRAARGSLVAVPRPLVRIRWHRSSWFEGRWGMIVDALEYLLQKHPGLRDDPVVLARISGQIAFAHAGSGNAKSARWWALQAIRANRRERRAYVALAVSLGLIPGETVLRLAHKRGKSI